MCELSIPLFVRIISLNGFVIATALDRGFILEFVNLDVFFIVGCCVFNTASCELGLACDFSVMVE